MRSVLALAGAILLAGSGLAVTATSVSAAPSDSLLTAAATALKQNAKLVKGSAQDRYTVYSSHRDGAGRGVVRYTRTYRGLRVSGGDLIVRVGAGGGFTGASVGLRSPLSLGVTPKVSAPAARATARQAFSGKVTSTGTPELFVDASAGEPVLAYETVIGGWAKDGQTPSRLHVVTDAATGAVRGSFDEIETIAGSGNSIYSGAVEVDSTPHRHRIQPDRPPRTATTAPATSTAAPRPAPPSPMTTTSGAVAPTPTAPRPRSTPTSGRRRPSTTSSMCMAATAFSVRVRGVPSRVHYGNAYVNAFWDGAQMTYGDGAGNAKPLVALDVAGHEMSHGVTENVVPGGLTYSGESGGLNEATSDIFGSMVEFYAGTASDPGDYDIGEKIDIRGTGAPLRYMYNPALDGSSSHGCWSSGTNGVDVHYSSGVANHFFFDLAEGTGATPYGTSPVCGAADPVTGIGREKAEKIWFRALDTYFVSTTKYVNPATPANTARASSLSAAADLYGFCGTDYKAVQAAWTAVNVAGSDYCPTAQDFSVGVTPASAAVSPGDAATTVLSTTVTNGEAEALTLTATGVPAGATVSFDPAGITAGESAAVTVATTAETPTGTYPITLTATSPSVAHSALFTLTVNSPDGCSGSNDSDVAIGDNTTVTSTIDPERLLDHPVHHQCGRGAHRAHLHR